MAPTEPFQRKPVPTGQVVRGPTPGDGIGHALRRTFGQDADVPAAWAEYLTAIDRVRRN